MNPSIAKLRKKYIDNLPDGMTSEDICCMSKDEDDLLPREQDITFSYISSKETCLWLKQSFKNNIVVPHSHFKRL